MHCYTHYERDFEGWRGLSERCGGSLVLSPWPVMVQRGLYLTITLMLWIPRVPFLIFPSSSPLHATPAYVPPAPSLASSCDNGVQQQTVFISDWPIISISSTSSSSLPLLQRTSIVVKTFYILSRTSKNRICCSDVQKGVLSFATTEPRENQKANWGFQPYWYACGYQ